MNTTTYTLTSTDQAVARPIATQLGDRIASALLRLQWLARRPPGRTPVLSEAAAELLRRADEYESTQSSYAADLRAAALQAS